VAFAGQGGADAVAKFMTKVVAGGEIVDLSNVAAGAGEKDDMLRAGEQGHQVPADVVDVVGGIFFAADDGGVACESDDRAEILIVPVAHSEDRNIRIDGAGGANDIGVQFAGVRDFFAIAHEKAPVKVEAGHLTGGMRELGITPRLPGARGCIDDGVGDLVFIARIGLGDQAGEQRAALVGMACGDEDILSGNRCLLRDALPGGVGEMLRRDQRIGPDKGDARLVIIDNAGDRQERIVHGPAATRGEPAGKVAAHGGGDVGLREADFEHAVWLRICTPRRLASDRILKPMALEKYKAKRHFNVTSEPKGKVAKRKAKEPIFVIQEHDASRHHYDFRLEAEGVLKSWAVPKEPTLDPTIKRLAVQVEDHPLEYAKFHGDIPEGQYGAGHVEIWDNGTYENLMEKKTRPMDVAKSVEAGHVEVELHGRKLKGAFVLVRTKFGRPGKDNWLLIKMKDEFAREGSEVRVRGSEKTNPDRRKAPSPVLPRGTGGGGSSPTKAPIAWTNVEKVMFPEKGYTKGDVLEFYLKMSEWLLTYLMDRPITVERLPDGVKDGGPKFWQKNTPEYYPQWIQRVDLPEQGGRRVQYALINDAQALMYFVNQGALTFHTYFSRVGNLERPDFVLFDLDPSGAKFSQVIQVAKELKKALDEEKVEAFVKTSGKSGLHVVTPCPGACRGYVEARAWAASVAGKPVRENREIATVERSKSGRHGRVYVDVEQNALGKHAVPPYVLRAVAEATVSVPLEWKELNSRLDPAHFDLKTALQRVKQKGDLWKDLRWNGR